MSLITFGPVYLLLTTDTWITPLGTQFPYADRSDFAFYADLAIQMTIGLLETMFTVSIEMSQVILNNVVIMGSDVATLNANEFGKQLLLNHASNVATRAKCRNIMLLVQDFDR